MGKKRLIWQLYPPYLLLIVICLAAITWYAAGSLRSFHLEQVDRDLRAKAILIANRIPETFSENPESIDALCKLLGAEISTRITVILPNGKVIGDSEKDPAQMEFHGDRAEIKVAYEGNTGYSTRYSRTLLKQMRYVAIPLMKDGKAVAVVRTSLPVLPILQALRGVYGKVAFSGLIIAAAAAILSLIISRKISRPLIQMERGAERFARGELDHRLPIPDSEEVGKLALAMNQMAAELASKIRTITRQRNEQEALLSSMVEGVLAVDNDENVIHLNAAAAGLLGVDASVTGRSIQEVVRNIELQQLIRQVLQTRSLVTNELTLNLDEEKILDVHGTLLQGAQDQAIGAVVVMHDVTRLRRLEKIRRDFVANVSHELKTPITVIGGYAETLVNGSVDTDDERRHFLEVIWKQAYRLNNIVDDLLALSKIESEAGTDQIALEECAVQAVVQAAVQTCEASAARKEIAVEVECGEEISCRLNPPLVEQALVNLIGNAIKYSDEKTTVAIEAVKTDNEINIRVKDQGPGIASEHLPRLFERFYRVDRARSRSQGGTGLGLAIVKHIALAHGGSVTVESTLGQGSTFTLHFPAA